MTAAEVTFTVPDAIDVIREIRREVGDALVLVQAPYSIPRRHGPRFWPARSTS